MNKTGLIFRILALLIILAMWMGCSSVPHRRVTALPGNCYMVEEWKDGANYYQWQIIGPVSKNKKSILCHNCQ